VACLTDENSLWGSECCFQQEVFLYEGKDGKDFLPFQVSSKFCPRDLDKKFIEGLRKWLVDFQLDEGIFKNKYIDIISK
jgi:hypothetical protein